MGTNLGAFDYNDQQQAAANAWNQAAANQWSNRQFDDIGSPVMGGFDDLGSRIPNQYVSNGADPRLAAAQMATRGRRRLPAVLTGDPHTDALLATIPGAAGRSDFLSRQLYDQHVPGYTINGNSAEIIGGPEYPDLHAAMNDPAMGDIGDLTPEGFLQNRAADLAAKRATQIQDVPARERLNSDPWFSRLTVPQQDAMGRLISGRSEKQEIDRQLSMTSLANRQKQGELLDNRLNGGSGVEPLADLRYEQGLQSKADKLNYQVDQSQGAVGLLQKRVDAQKPYFFGMFGGQKPEDVAKLERAKADLAAAQKYAAAQSGMMDQYKSTRGSLFKRDAAPSSSQAPAQIASTDDRTIALAKKALTDPNASEEHKQAARQILGIK